MTEKKIQVQDLQTNYKILGQGTPFLILHGWGSNSDRWVEVAQIIAQKNYQVIIPDMPGFGKSGALSEPWTANKYISWVEQFIKELNLQEFYLLGHSFGGALSCKLAINHPQQIKGLFLVAAAFIRKRTIKKQVLGRASKIAKTFSFLPYYSLAKKAFYKFVVGSDDYLKTEGVMKQTFMNVVSDDLSQFVAFIKVPTTIIWGDKDDSTLIEDAYFLNKKIKGSKLEVISGAGHNLHRETPETLAQKVLENI